jgi:hypothetical protein
VDNLDLILNTTVTDGSHVYLKDRRVVTLYFAVKIAKILQKLKSLTDQIFARNDNMPEMGSAER